MPLVTVVVPAFNRERLLPRCLNSIQAQNFSDWEAIVVDDRSTDETVKVAESFAKLDARIRCVANTQKKGPAGGRNRGIDEASGKYIAFLDSDDEWTPEHLQLATRYLEDPDAQIDVFTANPLRRRMADGTVLKRDELNLSQYNHRKYGDLCVLDSEGLFELALEGRRVLTTQTVVARREVFAKVRWDEDLFAMEDCLFPIDIAFHRFRVGHLQAFHVHYWVHDDNMTNGIGTHSAERMIPIFQGCVNLKQTILAKYPMSAAQRSKTKRELAEAFAWMLGYGGYAQLGNYAKARSCYWSAIKLTPGNLRYWKVYAASYLKQLMHR